MRTPEADYRNFKLSKLNSPEFSHLKLLFGWVVYFIFYFLTENLTPAESCYSVHCFLDDVIPFREEFVIPYIAWYGMIIFTLAYLGLYNIGGFRKFSKYIIVTQVAAISIYILFPTRQDLRPAVFPRENFLTSCVAFLYAIDTNTGVCPSLHVAYSLGMASVWLRERSVSLAFKGLVVAAVILVCLSTVFIKQHSAVDFFAALPICLLAEWLVFKEKI